jgi:hypothetical protein
MPQLSTPQILTNQERTLLELEYQKLCLDPQERDILWAKLHAYFLPLDAKADFSFFHDYFRWYTDLTWQRINILKSDEFISIAIGRQVYKAVQLGFDISRSLVYHLDFNTFEPETMPQLYERIRQAFLESSCIMGLEKNVSVTFSEFLKRLEKIKTLDALQKAESYTQWNQLLAVPDAYKEYYTVTTPDAMIDNIEGLATFFEGIQSKNIFYIVQAFMHPGLFDKAPQPVSSEPELVDTQEALLGEEGDENLDGEEEIDLEAAQIIAYEDIQAAVDVKFPKDETGQYQDIEGVFGYLEEIAEQYEDPRIAKLLYFDEKSGGFVWVSEDDMDTL